MTIGVIYCGYNTEEYVDQSIQPWINARENRLGGDEFVICAVSVPFEEYKDDPFKDSTTDALKDYYNNFKIDQLITEPKYVKEHVARDAALQWLLTKGVEIVCMVDSDEIFTESQISDIFNKVHLDRFTSWFSIQYRNFVFDKETYLIEPFTPPRIFRVNTNGYTLTKFFWDNDLQYSMHHYENSRLAHKEISYRELPHKLIRNTPVNHYTWMNNPSGKRKCAYQLKHFSGVCGYKWDENNNCLVFNEEYYAKIGQKIPITMKLFT
jgi:hypothetical protein